jgi:hypothetical protein
MVDNAQINVESSGQAAPAEPATRPARTSSLASIISRIERTVDEETAAIRTDVGFDLKTSNARKSRYLYELNRAVRGPGAAAMIAEQQDAIVRLREKLARNQDAILAHLNAVTEVATLIQGAIQRAEADGTYSAGEFAIR